MRNGTTEKVAFRGLFQRSQNSRGFTLIEMLISTGLTLTLFGFFLPGFTRSLAALSKEIDRTRQWEAALLTTLRVERLLRPARNVLLVSPTELQVTGTGEAGSATKLKYEESVVRVYDRSSVYPITARGDVEHFSFFSNPNGTIGMKWNDWEIPIYARASR